jgi:hypothetical protein
MVLHFDWDLQAVLVLISSDKPFEGILSLENNEKEYREEKTFGFAIAQLQKMYF